MFESFDEWINEKKVTPDRLPWEVLSDIANQIMERIPETREENINTYVEELADSITKIELWNASVDKLYKDMQKQKRDFSEKNLEDLKDKIERKGDLDPVLILDGEFIDGGHRLLAYKQLGREIIPAVDFKELLESEKEEFQ